MKKILARIMSLLIVATYILVNVPSVLAYDTESGKDMLQIYVSCDSNEGDGSFETPFPTLFEAKEYIRTLKKQGKYPSQGVTVNIREGRYFLESGLEFTKEDSGTDDAPVIWRAYGNEDVRLIGGISLDLSEFEKVSDSSITDRLPKESKDKVYQLDLKKYGFTKFDELPQTGHGTAYLGYIEAPYNSAVAMELFFADEPMNLSRWPNEGFVRFDAVLEKGEDAQMFRDNLGKNENWKPGPYKPTTFTVAEVNERMAQWKTAEDIWCFAYLQYDWSDLTFGVKYNPDTNSFTTRHTIGMPVTPGQRLYFYNILEELDIPNEWYLDRNNGFLYIYPSADSGEVSLSVLSDPILEFNGASNINVDSLTIQVVRNHAVTMTDSKNINIEHCAISKSTGQGVKTKDCENCKIISNRIFDTGAGGITLSGGNKETLEKGNNLAENNWIHDYSRILETYAAAVEITGVGNVARHNKMHGSNHLAMRISGNDNVAEYNEIFDVLRTAADMGAIYLYREKHERGNIISNNYIHDIKSEGSNASHGIQGIYFDEMHDGDTIENNVFVNFAGDCIFINGGRDVTMKNNLFINCDGGIKISAIGINPEFGYTDEKFQSHFPSIYVDRYQDKEAYKKYEHLAEITEDEPKAPKYNLVENNAYIGCGYDFKWCYVDSSLHPLLYETNTIVPGFVSDSIKNLGFMNENTGNYNLNSDSVIYEKLPEFKAPDFINMGMYTPWLARRLAGTVSLSPDSFIAYKGFTPGYIDSANYSVTPIIVDDVTYAPLRFVAESLGGEALYDAQSNVSTITLNNKTVVIDMNSQTIAHNGRVIEDAKYIEKDGRLLLPLRLIAESFDKTVTWYEEGIIIIGDDKVIEETEKNLIYELKRRMS